MLMYMYFCRYAYNRDYDTVGAIGVLRYLPRVSPHGTIIYIFFIYEMG